MTENENLSVAAIMKSYDIPETVWKPIMITESNGDANAYVNNDIEESVGLFQLNRKGGLGVGYSVEQLKNPIINATIAAKAMQTNTIAAQGTGMYGYELTKYVAANSGWPTSAGLDSMPGTYATRLSENYNFLFGNGASEPSQNYGDTSYGGIGGLKTIDFTSLTGSTLTAFFWIVIGVILVFAGVKIATNPFANLTDSIAKLGAVKNVVE